jgi:ABC-type antimicrobial peptide transport system permease subunit
VDSVNLLIRTKGDPRLWIEPVRRTITGLIADYPLAPITFNEWMDFSLIADRIAANCVAAIGSLGLILAILGLVGTVSYSVSERKKELGIRVALGAQRGHLIGMILRQTALVTGIGVAIGTILGVCVTVLLESEFYGVRAIELTVLIPVCLAMLGLSLTVAYAAARPWLAVDPLEAVRHS